MAKKKNNKEHLKIPRSAQKSIPIKRLYKDGIYELPGGEFSRSWRYRDINYTSASKDDKKSILTRYCGVINAAPTDGHTKISIIQRSMNQKEFRESTLMRTNDDGLDTIRGEYNKILVDKAAETANLVKELVVTVSSPQRNIEEARSYLARVGSDMATGYSNLGSKVQELNVTERLQLLHQFFRIGEEQHYNLNFSDMVSRGHDFRDLICPDSIKFNANYFEIGNGKVGRVLFMKNYGSYIKDSTITELTSYDRNLVLSIDLFPADKDKAVDKAQKALDAVNTDVNRWQQRQNKNYNFSAQMPYHLEYMRDECKRWMSDLKERDLRMIFTSVTLVHIADSLEQLNSDTERFQAIARKDACELGVLVFQQEDGLNTVLPYGPCHVRNLRTLNTESVAALTPFGSQEIRQTGGTYYGVNANSRNLIILNRLDLNNGNGMILGSAGAGKGVASKMEIAYVAASRINDEIIIVDPEAEYSPLVKALGGVSIPVAAGTGNYINAMDMDIDYGDKKDPVTIKAEFIMALCEKIMKRVEPNEASIIDRCTSNVYRDYISGESKLPPTLKNLRQDLMRQPEPEAKRIATSLEYFTDGTLDVFAHQTNVDVKNRIIAFNIMEMSKQLKAVGMLVLMDFILSKVMANRRKGITTWVYFDEMHLLFSNDDTSEFLATSWKRYRKYGGIATGITQQIEDCLYTKAGKAILGNSEFMILLKQAPTDRIPLAKLLNISQEQLAYIGEGTRPGHGLIKAGGLIVPFANELPLDTELFKLVNTSPNRDGIRIG